MGVIRVANNTYILEGVVDRIDSRNRGANAIVILKYDNNRTHDKTFNIPLSRLKESSLDYVGAHFWYIVHSSGDECIVPDKEAIMRDTQRTKRAIDDFMALGGEEWLG